MALLVCRFAFPFGFLVGAHGGDWWRYTIDVHLIGQYTKDQASQDGGSSFEMSNAKEEFSMYERFMDRGETDGYMYSSQKLSCSLVRDVKERASPHFGL